MRHRRAAAALLAVAVTLTGCAKATTFNPHAAPDAGELDRLQKIVNDRPDIETTKTVLFQLDTAVRAAIAKHSPRTQLTTFGINEAQQGCQYPFTWSIGQEYESARYSGDPVPDAAQWQQIVDELDPVFAKAGFGRGDGARPDHATVATAYGASVELVNGTGGAPLMYQLHTACQLPAAWRTGAPPSSVAAGDTHLHFPYLFGGDGGRNRPPGG